jgi:hypothetical protein
MRRYHRFTDGQNAKNKIEDMKPGTAEFRSGKKRPLSVVLSHPMAERVTPRVTGV